MYLPKTNGPRAAVDQVLQAWNSIDFAILGYQLQMKDGIAIVDLRILPEAERALVSLATCEKFSLFGSLRETLTQHRPWGIREVRFRSLGKDLKFF